MKGFISLEYILLFASVLSILSITVVGVISLYNRNITAIDNSRFLDFCKELKSKVELMELMPEGKLEIEARNLKDWELKKNNSREIELTNETKNCKINTTLSITGENQTFKNNQKITLQKQNNTLNIN
ncbi:MAG: hypothetical protein WCX82_00995 [archaeon]|jgi:hypothetical protein